MVWDYGHQMVSILLVGGVNFRRLEVYMIKYFNLLGLMNPIDLLSAVSSASNFV